MKDVIVVGGGPAGSVTAMLLARQGWSVTLAERQTFPRQKACGDCLSPGINPVLRRLGVWEDVLRACPAHLWGWRLVSPNESSFTTHFKDAANHGENGLAISRDRFDAVLLEHARRAGVEVLYDAHVTDLCRDPDGAVTGVRLQRDDNPSELHARFIVGADGLRSVIARRLKAHDRRPHLRKTSFTLHAKLPTRDHVGEMRLLEDACLGIAPVTDEPDGIHNITLVLNRGTFTRSAGMQTILRDGLRRFGMQDVAEGAEILTSGPFDWPTRLTVFDGAALVGDAAGYYDPFTGQGIYQAVITAEMLAEHADIALRRHDSVRAVDLAGFARAQSRVTRAARAVQRIIEFVCARPHLADRVFRKFAREDSIARALIGVTADLVPPRRLLSPRLWARLAL